MSEHTLRQVVFLASPAVWERGHGPDHPLKPERLRRTYELLDEAGALAAANVRLVSPRPATEPELSLFHTRNYIHAVRDLSADPRRLDGRRYGFGPGDNPIFAGMYDSERLKVGAALQAAELLLGGECDVAFSFSGGLHHGRPDSAAGFCVFNDAAVAIHWLLRQGQRVAYVDIDVHHGDGVQAAFYDSERVLTISLHQDGRTLFPGTGAVEESGRGDGLGASLNVPLPPFTDDELYLWAFREVVPPLLARFQADVVVTQLGVDTHFQDPLASLSLTTRGHQALFEELGRLAPRWLALGGGGYNLSVVPRSWALAFEVMSGFQLPAGLPAGYQARYGERWLHDQEVRLVDRSDRQRLAGVVEAIVARVRRLHTL